MINQLPIRLFRYQYWDFSHDLSHFQDWNSWISIKIPNIHAVILARKMLYPDKENMNAPVLGLLTGVNKLKNQWI